MEELEVVLEDERKPMRKEVLLCLKVCALENPSVLIPISVLYVLLGSKKDCCRRMPIS